VDDITSLKTGAASHRNLIHQDLRVENLRSRRRVLSFEEQPQRFAHLLRILMIPVHQHLG
jgi:hypothetical protein